MNSSETFQRVDTSTHQKQSTGKKQKWCLVLVSKLEKSAEKGNWLLICICLNLVNTLDMKKIMFLLYIEPSCCCSTTRKERCLYLAAASLVWQWEYCQISPFNWELWGRFDSFSLKSSLLVRGAWGAGAELHFAVLGHCTRMEKN